MYMERKALHINSDEQKNSLTEVRGVDKHSEIKNYIEQRKTCDKKLYGIIIFSYVI